MDFTAFNERMVCEDKIKRYEAEGIPLGYEFKMRYPTYRGSLCMQCRGAERHRRRPQDRPAGYAVWCKREMVSDESDTGTQYGILVYGKVKPLCVFWTKREFRTADIRSRWR